MELLGAVTATNLAKYVTDALQGTIQIKQQVLWIDSQIVISWIKSKKSLPTYVNNRVKNHQTVPRKNTICAYKGQPCRSSYSGHLTKCTSRE